jgi:hypothetical protein
MLSGFLIPPVCAPRGGSQNRKPLRGEAARLRVGCELSQVGRGSSRVGAKEGMNSAVRGPLSEGQRSVGAGCNVCQSLQMRSHSGHNKQTGLPGSGGE